MKVLASLILASMACLAATDASADVYSFTFTATATSTLFGGDGQLHDASGYFETSGGPLPVGIGVTTDPQSTITTSIPGYNVVSGILEFDNTWFALEPNRAPAHIIKDYFAVIGNDVFYPSAPPDELLDTYGLAFVATDGSGRIITINALTLLGGPYDLYESVPIPYDPQELYLAAGNFSVAPELPTAPLALTGVVGLAALLRFRRCAFIAQL